MPKRDLLNEAYGRLNRLLPKQVRPVMRWLHAPKSRPVRIPLGVFCIIASFFWFLPVVGLEFFPLGLLLLAHDVPFLRRPASRLTIWLIERIEGMRRFWQRHLKTNHR